MTALLVLVAIITVLTAGGYGYLRGSRGALETLVRRGYLTKQDLWDIAHGKRRGQ